MQKFQNITTKIHQQYDKEPIFRLTMETIKFTSMDLYKYIFL